MKTPKPINIDIDPTQFLAFARKQEEDAIAALPQMVEDGLMTAEEVAGIRELCEESIRQIDEQSKPK